VLFRSLRPEVLPAGALPWVRLNVLVQVVELLLEQQPEQMGKVSNRQATSSLLSFPRSRLTLCYDVTR
jgi:hypothetical protein